MLVWAGVPIVADVTDDERWHQVLQRQASAEPFFYAVRTTRIFCRPTCPSRRPKRANVVFFDAPEQARVAGYRACLRCRPDEPGQPDGDLRAVVSACRAMVAVGGPLSLERLERVTGVGGRRLSRAFQDAVGATPRSFGDTVRSGTARPLLQDHGRVTSAVFAAGFGSLRGFYETTATTLGMTASAYASGGRGEQLLWAAGESPVGRLLAVASARGLCAVRIGPDVPGLLAEVRTEFPQAQMQQAPDVLYDVLQALAALAAGAPAGHDLPVDLRGTAFQARVWSALRLIPPGESRTYRQVAEQVDAPAAVRAVASACAANRVALVVPCHRVVRSDGGLAGYRWGLAVKQSLLESEHRPTRIHEQVGG